MLDHPTQVLKVKLSRLAAEPTYSESELRNRLKGKYNNSQI